MFSKYNNALTGHRSSISVPKSVSQLDYEGELVIVIGKEAYCVSAETGTPSGVIMGKAPEEQNWLQPGDVVTIVIDKLGSLTNFGI